MLLIVMGYVWYALARSLPALQPTHLSLSLPITTTSGSFSWPADGQTAVGIVGDSAITSHGSQKPIATASTAKLITALTVLHVKPLTTDLHGPMLTLSAHDVALYREYVAKDGSVVGVADGEQISEYQVLEAMLLPSANNLSDSLAEWAFGSLANYSAYANKYIVSLGLKHTHVGSDASGFSGSTTSTASDLVRLGQLVMQQPALKTIVAKPSASGLPVVGTIHNVNQILGVNGVIGIKTGNNTQDPGVFLGAARVPVNGQHPIIVTALLGSSSLWQAMHDSLGLIKSAEHNFAVQTLIHEQSVVGEYQLPWSGTVGAAISSNLKATVWPGETVKATVHLQPISLTAHPGQQVGTIVTQKSLVDTPRSVPIELTSAPAPPSLWWRLTHPF